MSLRDYFTEDNSNRRPCHVRGLMVDNNRQDWQFHPTDTPGVFHVQCRMWNRLVIDGLADASNTQTTPINIRFSAAGGTNLTMERFIDHACDVFGDGWERRVKEFVDAVPPVLLDLAHFTSSKGGLALHISGVGVFSTFPRRTTKFSDYGWRFAYRIDTGEKITSYINYRGRWEHGDAWQHQYYDDTLGHQPELRNSEDPYIFATTSGMLDLPDTLSYGRAKRIAKVLKGTIRDAIPHAEHDVDDCDVCFAAMTFAEYISTLDTEIDNDVLGHFIPANAILDPFLLSIESDRDLAAFTRWIMSAATINREEYFQHDPVYTVTLWNGEAPNDEIYERVLVDTLTGKRNWQTDSLLGVFYDRISTKGVKSGSKKMLRKLIEMSQACIPCRCPKCTVYRRSKLVLAFYKSSKTRPATCAICDSRIHNISMATAATELTRRTGVAFGVTCCSCSAKIARDRARVDA